MIENIFKSVDLAGLARKRNKSQIVKTIHAVDLEKYQEEGWKFLKNLKTGVQVAKNKAHGAVLEDKVWRLFYKMGFSYLSGEGGGKLIYNNEKKSQQGKSQIDIIAIDDEVAIIIECKSSLSYRKRPEFQEELGKLFLTKELITSDIRKQFSEEINAKDCIKKESIKKQVVLAMFLNKIILTESDKEIARSKKVIIFDENDLAYYEHLVNHLGPAAKYQILADMLPGKEVAGLKIKLPAIKTKMGSYNCFTFSISPEYLLKISYVSHRSKGKASDINAYQRMLTKSRLNNIKEYISNNGIFPTNIVLNFEKDRLQFQKIRQESESHDDIDVGVLGWLDIKPSYKSAWIIDGQHRLFAYSGHDKAIKSKLTVLAFEGLKPSMQAKLFIDINAKQKSVKQSLLQELFAELNWDADDLFDRIGAIISKAVQDLNNDPEFELYKRIQVSDSQKDFLKCITLNSLFTQIEKKGFFIQNKKQTSVLEYGPLWAGDKSEETLQRTKKILKEWINQIASLNKDWWDKGSDEGGGLAMNDGVATLIEVLRSVFETIEKKNIRLVNCSEKELCEIIKPFGKALGEYLSSYNENQRKSFRELRALSGIAQRVRMCQEGMRNILPTFNPEGLDEWIEEQKQETNKNAKEIIDEIEKKIQKHIVEELKNEFGTEEDSWWYNGIPNDIRTKATTRREEDRNRRGGGEFYLDLIEYKKIIKENWELFEKAYSYGKGNKDKKLEWFDFINETRKIVAHASSGKTVKLEDFTHLKEIHSQTSKNVFH